LDLATLSNTPRHIQKTALPGQYLDTKQNLSGKFVHLACVYVDFDDGEKKLCSIST
jgi:hypothetical protein